VRFGLRAKLLIATLVVVNVAFISVWIISTVTARQGMVALADENLGLGAKNLADGVAQLVTDTYADGLTTSRLDLPAQAIETGDPKNIAWYSDEMVQQKGRYTAIIVANKDGKIVGANTVGRDGHKLERALLGGSLASEAWAASGLVAPRGQGTWVPPSKPAFLDGVVQEDDGVVGFCFPVFDVLDERIGTLTILLSLSSIGRQLDGFLTGAERTESAALLVDASGAPIALPLSLPRRDEWRMLHLDAAPATGHASLVDPSGAAHFVVARPVGGAAAAAHWRVAATKTASALDAPVDRIGNSLLAAFLAAVLATTLILVIAGSRLVKPIQTLTDATRTMGKASEYRPLAVKTTDEVGLLTASFNTLFASLREHEQGLEEKVRERTADLEAARRDLADILDNMRQGIFTIGPDGSVGGEYSAFTKTLFAGEQIGGASAISLLQIGDQGGPDVLARMEFWLENVFGADELQWLLASKEGIESVTLKPVSGGPPKYLELEYAPVFKDGALAKLMVVAKDVTELRSLEAEMRTKDKTHQESLARIGEIAAMDADLFATFTTESRVLLGRCEAALSTLERRPNDRPSVDEIFRAVHTLKGNARIFHVSAVQALAHEVETEFQALRDAKGTPSAESLETAKQRIAALSAEFDEIERIGKQVLFGDTTRRRGGPTVRVHESRILEVRRRFKDVERAAGGRTAKAEIGALGAAVQALTFVPLAELFERFRKVVFDLGRDLGKSVNDLEVAGEDIAVDAKLVDRLRDVLVHAAKNAIDHGIETPSARVAAGKPEKGTLKLEARWEEARVDATGKPGQRALVLELSDDGAGFDLERVKRRAFEQRVITEADLDRVDDAGAVELAFLPGVSTSDDVTDVSGRGVGMDVVRSVVAELRGTAEVSTRRGTGTTLTLKIPAEYHQHL
jgi:HPt (histidine-containing phosphotransfer) domain-containing protein/PAS domain-containing protein